MAAILRNHELTVQQLLRRLSARVSARVLVQDALLLPELPPEARAAVRRMGRAERAGARSAPAVGVHTAATPAADFQPATGVAEDLCRMPAGSCKRRSSGPSPNEHLRQAPGGAREREMRPFGTRAVAAGGRAFARSYGRTEHRKAVRAAHDNRGVVSRHQEPALGPRSADHTLAQRRALANTASDRAPGQFRAAAHRRGRQGASARAAIQPDQSHQSRADIGPGPGAAHLGRAFALAREAHAMARTTTVDRTGARGMGISLKCGETSGTAPIYRTTG